jgi:lipopolysaccharide transport system ATP-binding protein
LGAGFNPILTGRENIYANMAILGLPTRQIRQRFDEVVDFAEMWDAIDAPVQGYSSGMAARLGFACAVHIEPDILLIDEVLAVGDVRFRMKCYQRLAKLRQQGTSFVLVSHNPHAVLNVCETSLYLRKGQRIDYGPTDLILRRYEEDLGIGSDAAVAGVLHRPAKDASTSLGLDILSMQFKADQGQTLTALQTGEPVTLALECLAHRPIPVANVGVMVTAVSGEQERVLALTSASDNTFLSIPAGLQEIQLRLPYCGLIPGNYSLKIYIKEGIRSLDIVESFGFTVRSTKVTSQCLFYQPHSWQIQQPMTRPLP